MKKSFLRLSLLAQFSIASFIIMLAIAVALGYFLQQQLVWNALEQEAENTVSDVQTFISPNLQSADFDGMNATRLAQLDALIHNHILSRHIVRLKIWNKQGMLLYSEDSSLIGNQFPLSDELEQAFDGKVAMEVSDLTKPENVSEVGTQSRLFEIYVPLRPRDRNEILGAFEIYHDYNAIKPFLDSLTSWLHGGLAIGFSILYISLFTIVRRASHKLIRREQENAALYEKTRQHVRKLSALRDIDRAISSTLDLKETLDVLLVHAIEHVGHGDSAAAVALVEPGTDILQVHATRNLGETYARRFVVRVGESIVGQVVQDGEPRIVTDLAADPRVKFPDLRDSENLVSMLAVPMRVEKENIGVLILYTRHRHEFTDEEKDFFVTLGGQAAIAVQNAQLYQRTRHQAESLERLTAQLEQSYTATLAAMSAALDARDHETEGHSQRVARLTCEIAQAMGTFAAEEMIEIERGALLHDIGKIGVSDAILLKPGALTDSEWDEMKKHPEIGARIIEGIDFLRTAQPIIYSHQERWNGRGYPLGLKGEAIPLIARIFAVADVFDALTSDRPYRRALDRMRAIEYIRDQSGIEFDPRVVDKFLRVMSVSVSATVFAE